MANVVNARPAIGIEGAVYAVLTESSDVTGGTPVYGTVQPFFPSAKITVKPNGSATTDYGDDGAVITSTTTGVYDITLEALDFDPQAYSVITGQTRANGIAVDGSLDSAPYIAFGYKQWLGNTNYRYKWLLKGKFSKSDEGGETKKDKISFQHMTLTGNFVRLNANNAIQSTIRTDATDTSAATVTNWFAAPVISSSSDNTALTLTSAVGTISTKTFVLTFNKASATPTTIMDGSTLNVAIAVASTGTLIALTTFTPGASNANPTLSVVTSATLTGVPYTVFVTQDLHDANGTPCVQKAVTVTPS